MPCTRHNVLCRFLTSCTAGYWQVLTTSIHPLLSTDNANRVVVSNPTHACCAAASLALSSARRLTALLLLLLLRCSCRDIRRGPQQAPITEAAAYHDTPTMNSVPYRPYLAPNQDYSNDRNGLTDAQAPDTSEPPATQTFSVAEMCKINISSFLLL